MKLLLTLAVATVVVSQISGASVPVKRQDDRTWYQRLSDTVQNIHDRIHERIDSWSWNGDEDHIVDKTEEAAQKSNENIEEGNQLIARGEALLESSANILGGLSDEQQTTHMKSALDAVRETAKRVIRAGTTILNVNQNITDALNNAVDDIDAVVQATLPPVAEAASDAADSIQGAVGMLTDIQSTVQTLSGQGDGSKSVVESISEILNLGDLVARASERARAVAQDVTSLGKALSTAGHNIWEAVRNSWSNVRKAFGR